MIYSSESEIALLGTMLIDPKAIDIASNLETSAMYLDSHRQILTTIRSMHAQGLEVDLTTLVSELRRTGRLDAVGGVGYIADLSSHYRRTSDVTPYMRIIREKATLRSILSLCDTMKARVEDGEESETILHDIQGRALEFQSSSLSTNPIPIAETIVPSLEIMNHQRTFSGEVLGIPTGIAELDANTTGWRNGELTYVGAMPSRGKTSFLLQAMYAAATRGFGVGCISLEMRSEQLVRRLNIIHSGIPAERFRDVRTMSGSDFQIAKNSLFSLGDLPITICDQSGLKPAQISSLARRMHSMGAQIIFIDFVQIIHEDGKDRREAINRVSAALRDTCKAIDIPFVVASQLARRDANPNRRPTIQDLRESGNLEQDAHNVLLLYRPKDDNGQWTGEDEIIVDKQREGRTGVIAVRYDSKTLTYVER